MMSLQARGDIILICFILGCYSVARLINIFNFKELPTDLTYI